MSGERGTHVVIDAGTQTLRCELCDEQVPLPLGLAAWVLTVCDAFAKAHPARSHQPGRTGFTRPRDLAASSQFAPKEPSDAEALQQAR